MSSESKRVRIQLDMSPEEAQELDYLRETCGLRSRSDAVRTALSVIDWVSRESVSGHRIVALGENVVSEFVMPGITFKQRNDQ